jgi:hypothetical protein
MPAIMPASTKGGGTCLGVPDVCLTPAPPAPPVPVPYPNTAQLTQATNVSTKVKFMSKEVVTVQSEIPQSMGDEAGTNGGVTSGVNMQKVTFKKGSSKVKVQGQACYYATAMSAHNGASANMPAGLQVAPSQTKVLVGM